MEEIKPTLTAPLDVKPVESKPADKPVVPVAQAPEAAKPAGDDKSKSVETKATEKPADQKPAEELKSLLDEADEEEVTPEKQSEIDRAKAADLRKAPEKYEPFKLAEGLVLDQKQMDVVLPLFQKLNLSQTEAQELVDLQTSLVKQSEEAHVAAWDVFVEGQKTEAKNYFGTKLPEVMRNVARARDTFMPKDASGKSALQDKINAAGFSNDKDFLEMMDKVGRVIGEGKFVSGKQSAPAKGDGSTKVQGASLADVYPSMSTK